MIRQCNALNVLDCCIEDIFSDVSKRPYFFLYPNENAYLASLCVIPAIDVYIDGVIVINDNIPLGTIGSKEILLAYYKMGKKAFYKKACEIMTKINECIKEYTTLKDLIDCLRRNRIGFAPIVRESKIVGVISFRDILKIIAKSNIINKVEEICSRLVLTNPYHNVRYALELMFEKNIRRVIIKHENTYAITDRNILDFLMANEFENKKYKDPLDVPLAFLNKHKLINIDLDTPVSHAAKLMLDQLPPSALLVSNNYIVTPWDLIHKTL